MRLVFSVRFLALVVLLLALVGAGWWLWTRATDSTPVSEGRAIEDYRAGGSDTRLVRGAPAPGVYTYAVSGWERGEAGPVHLRRDLPAQARYIVRTLRRGFEGQLALSAEHVEGVRYRVAPTGLRETWRRTDVTFLGFGRDDRRALTPQPLFMPGRPVPGRSWRDRYRAGDLPVSVRSRILRTEAVRVAGREVPAVVVQVDSVTGGAHPGTRSETLWWAPSLGLPVRQEVRMDIGGPVGFTVRARLDLASTAPRT